MVGYQSTKPEMSASRAPGESTEENVHNHADVSVVIPARNEEATVGNCVSSVLKSLEDELTVEVVVVDDGSEDNTAKCASAAGATVVQSPPNVNTIAGLRNYGASTIHGELLVFLDADVIVQESWGGRLSDIYSELTSASRVITGSQCQIPADPSWVEEYWFDKRRARSRHLGSGNLIMSFSLFREVGGFDERLTTGEDYDLCRRARKIGGVIRPDPELKAVHMGYPQTVSEFARREMWHGLGDASSLMSVLRSKVAVASITFCSAAVIATLGVFLDSKFMVVSGAGVSGVVLVAAVLIQFGRLRFSDWTHIVPLYVVYFTARSIAAVLGPFGMVHRWR